MSLTRYTASADNTITNAFKPYTTNRAFYANMGAADSLEMFSIYHSGSQPEISRILINFPFEKIESDKNSGLIPTNSKFYLKLFNVKHPETLPKNYYAIVHGLSSSWDEGYGLDLENYLDLGQSGSYRYGSNWKFRSTTALTKSWIQDGGDYIVSSSNFAYFDNGTEDLIVDVTEIVNFQLNNSSMRNGFIVMLSGAYEDGINQQNYYTKRFSARSSEYFYKRPILEARWESSLQDDRGNFYFINNNLSEADNTNNIYFYNRVNGVLKDIVNNPTVYVKIIDENDTTVSNTVVAQKIANGTYKAAVAATGSSEQLLTDVWYSGSNAFYSGSIEAKIRNFDNILQQKYVLSLTNLKSYYTNKENARFKIFARVKNWSPNIYLTSNNSLNSLTFNNLYYKIYRIVDNLEIIPYGIEPVKYTKCSYDVSGNFFDLDMGIFEPGYMYAIKFMLVEDNLQQELPETFTFKVQ